MILGIIAMLIGVLICSAIVVFVNMILNFDVLGFSMLFIVPVGSIAFGTLASLGYYAALVKTNIKVTFAKGIVSVVILIIAFMGINYYMYSQTYLDEAMNINYVGHGDHVSEFVNDDNEALTFPRFYKFSVENRSISFSRDSREIGQVEGNVVLNWIFEVITFAGLLIGAFLGFTSILGSKTYCDACNKYMKNRDVFSFDLNDSASEKLKMLDGIGQYNSQSCNNLAQLIEQNRITKKYKTEYIKGSVSYCTDCNRSILKVTTYHLNSKKALVADTKNALSYSLEPLFLNTLLS